MTQERKQAEEEVARITEAIRETGYRDAVLIAAMSYAKGLVEGQQLARMQQERASA